VSTTTGPASIPLHETPLAGVTTVIDKKTPVLLSALALVLLAIVAIFPEPGKTTYRLAVPSDFAQLPTATVPSTPTAWVVIVLCALCAVWSIILYRRHRITPFWVVVVYSGS
jgi:simple sugar transport system permease protein